MSEFESKMLLKSIGYRIKAEREKKGLTQEQFADKYGYARTTLAKLEAGIRDFKSTEIVALAEQLNVSCDYLLCGTVSKKADNIGINIRLGLSDEAIETLERLNGSYNYAAGVSSLKEALEEKLSASDIFKQQLDAINLLLACELDDINIFELVAAYLWHDYEALPLKEDSAIRIDSEKELVRRKKYVSVYETNSGMKYSFPTTLLSCAIIANIQKKLDLLKQKVDKGG